MLKDLSYKDSEIEKEINNLIGKEFNLLEKLKERRNWIKTAHNQKIR